TRRGVPKDLLVEIGAEEIPASFIAPAAEELRRLVLQGLAASRLAHGESHVFSTPRRLALLIKSVAEASEDVSREVVGPSAKAAFDAQGNPTQAAEKFAAGLKGSVRELSRIQTPRGEYVAAQIVDKGRPAQSILPEVLSAAIHRLSFKKSMRWGDVEQTFARPVHWIVALFGEEVLPVAFGDVRSGRIT